MTLNRAIEVLEDFNEWRRGKKDDTYSPVEIGIALDLVITYHKNNVLR